MPNYLSFHKTVLGAIMNETTMRMLGYTADEINSMPKWKVELYARVTRGTGLI